MAQNRSDSADTDLDSVSTRHRSKAMRRSRILDTASVLLADGGPENLTMRRLAQAADLSVNTIYNLIGPREAIIASLVGRVLDAIEPGLEVDGEIDPIDRCRAVIEHSTEMVIAQGALTRPLALEIFGHGAPASAIARARGTTLMRRALIHARDDGLIGTSLDPAALAETVYAVWSNGALRWAQGAITDEAFTAAGLHGLYVALVAAATPSARDHLLLDLADIDRRLTRAPEPGRRPPLPKSA